MPEIKQKQEEEELKNSAQMLPQRWIIFPDLPISCVGGMAVLAVMLKHTMADMQVTSLPPLWQSFTKMLILLGSNLTVVYIRTTLCDLWGQEVLHTQPKEITVFYIVDNSVIFWVKY